MHAEMKQLQDKVGHLFTLTRIKVQIVSTVDLLQYLARFLFLKSFHLEHLRVRVPSVLHYLRKSVVLG
jgi:hypothetical protein